MLNDGATRVLVLGLELPGGNFVATASIQASRELVDIPVVHCRLEVPGTATFLQEVGREPMTFAFTEAFSLGAPTDVLLTCDQTGFGRDPGQAVIQAATLVAIEVETLVEF